MTIKSQALREVAADKDLMFTVGRLAVEDELVDMRDRNMFMLRNNGLVIKNTDGSDSSLIRLPIEMAVKIALEAMADELEKNDA